MTLQRKLALFLLVAALAPVVLVGFVMIRRTEAVLGRAATAEELARAEAAASGIDLDVAGVDAAIRKVAARPRLEGHSESALRAILSILVGQLEQVDAAILLDAAGELRAREGGREADAVGLRAAVSPVRLPGDDLAFLVYREGDEISRLAAISPAGREGWRLAVRVRTELLRRRLDPAVPEGGAAWIASADALVVGSTGATPLDAATRAELRGRVDPERSGTLVGATQVAAWAPLRGLPGWVVLVTVPSRAAFAHVEEMRRAVLLSIFVVTAGVLALSFLLARRTTAGIARIDAAARALGAGELAVRLPDQGRDEIGQVSRTFNAMAGELQRSRAKLERWNEELVAEVEARTAELRAAQAQLVEAQKLAAIGQLGAGVAHEINNPLTGILGNAQLLLERVKQEGPDRDALEKIEALARRCRDITQNLLRFSEQRQAGPDPQVLDLNKVVVDALGLVDGQLREGGIALSLELAAPPPRARGDAGQLAQVVLNLVQNARTACLERPGSQLRVVTRPAAEAGKVELLVVDNGKGILPEHLPRIFEPFFTTKDLWSNVGLGLSVTYRIVQEHGGRIAVESRPGEGSTFTVTLPAAENR
ncbi:MAG: ATP-binding protein [Anaeromyxobacteraceae bacterium]